MSSTLRAMNKSLVLNIIRQEQPLSRAQIAKKAKLTRSTISEIVQELLDEKVIYEKGVDNAGLGRKGVLLHFNDNYRYVIGIDLGGTKISMGLIDFGGHLIQQKTIPTFTVKDNQRFIHLLAQEITTFITENNQELIALHAIGIASPGIIDYHNGMVIEGSPNLPEWENLPLSQVLRQYFSVPVIIENDVRAALIGEIWHGACQDTNNALLLSLGTGIGSALLMDGKIVRGSQNAAGEIGYMLFTREHLQKDWLQGDGCFEFLASGPNLVQQYARSTSTKRANSASDVFQLARSGDTQAIAIIEQMIEYVSISLINVVTMINPEKIIITGGVSHSSDLFLEKLRHNVRSHTLQRNQVQIEITQLYERAAIYGIAILALSSTEPAIRFVEAKLY